ncbi:mitochondrial dicarboxylate/tricarboxylate transporter DTC-like [Apium graveolens]|uniref:mitochondrial dicarboxylate/tricarboxylate transporter DTC-like n=1 Tax=Apium graveolens TaxID=4045 RepID=UPI003D79CBC7
MEKEGTGDAAKGSIVLPFVQGGLTELLSATSLRLGWSLRYKLIYHNLSSTQRTVYQSYFKRFPVTLFVESTNRAFQFGSFEILKQSLEATNNGRPLNLNEEASCGMAAGAIGAIFGSPLSLASSRIQANAKLMSVQQSYFRNLLLDLCHTVMDKGVLAMYKGGGPYTAWSIGFYGGMFASYGRSVSYFKDTSGLSKSQSQFAASAVSGFVASVCGLPCFNLANALKSSQIHGKMILYKGFKNYTSRTVISVMAIWYSYEIVQDVFSELP